MIAQMTSQPAPTPDLDTPPQTPDWPLFGLTDDIRPALAEVLAANRPVAVVTMIHADGGSPRPPGSQMLVTADAMSGFLSGGCVEADVAAHARAALADGNPRRLVYGEGSPWPDIRLLCGARIELLVEPLGAGDPAAATLTALRAARQPALWITDGRNRTCEAVEAAPCTAQISVSDTPLKVRLLLPPQRRMVVVGGDPTALATARLAADMGYDTHLVRPRGPAHAPPGEAFHYHRSPAAAALATIGLDPWSFVAVATHDTDIDEEALLHALPSAAAYVGVLGARRRIAERLARLAALGVAPEPLARLRAPIGLDLGGKAPVEIAVAVMAEVTATANASSAGS